jgi:hypothetical protein
VRVLPQSDKVGAVHGGQAATNGPTRKFRWRLVVGCAGFFLLAIAAVYAAIRVQEVIPTEMQTAQPKCFVRSWEPMLHPSTSDVLCRD